MFRYGFIGLLGRAVHTKSHEGLRLFGSERLAAACSQGCRVGGRRPSLHPKPRNPQNPEWQTLNFYPSGAAADLLVVCCIMFRVPLTLGRLAQFSVP